MNELDPQINSNVALWRRGVVAVTALAITAFAALHDGSEPHVASHHASRPPIEVGVTPANNPADECPSVTTETLTAVDAMLAEPIAPEMQDVKHQLSYARWYQHQAYNNPKRIEGKPAPISDSREITDEAKRHVAENLGLTLIAPPKQLEAFYWGDYEETEPTFAQAYELTKNFLAEYGVELTISQPEQNDPTITGINIGPVQADRDWDNVRAAFNLAVLATEFSHIPKEFIADIGLKRISLANITSENVAAFVPVAIAPDEIVYDPMRSGQNVIDHEVGHITDGAYCNPSSIYHDPQFDAINPGEKSVYRDTLKHERLGYYSKDGLSQIYGMTYSRLQEFGLSGYIKQQLAFQRTAEAEKRTIADTEHALDNVAEDKAEILQGILLGEFNDLYSHRPVLVAKARMEIGRIAAMNLAVARFYTLTANRPYMGTGSMK